jgi:S-disulfanyl-L-cysteine oxidoreductase SoxD
MLKLIKIKSLPRVPLKGEEWSAVTPPLLRGGKGGIKKRGMNLKSVLLLFLFFFFTPPIFAQNLTGIGRPATSQEIQGWDIAIKTDGSNLPEGQGTAKQGEPIFIEKCASCHGEFGESAGRWPVLAGGKGTLKSHDPVKSVGSYWPFATTLWDYINRAMPYGNAQSLEANEVYALSAYILSLDDIIKDDFVLDKKSLSALKMPNQGNFFEDDREISEKSFWKKSPCMKDCVKIKAEITGRARVIDVTPESGKTPKAD